MKRTVLILVTILLLLSSLISAQEVTVIRMGAVADRPACSVARVLWFVTDTGSQRWTYCDGSSWSDIAPGLNAGALPITYGGTGQATASTAFNGLAPSKTGNSLKFLRVNSGETDYELATVAGGGDALVGNPLSQFAATTSLQLKGVLSDETGSGLLVFGTSPNITTPTGIVKGDVGLGSVDNTSDAGKPVSTAQQTALDLKANLSGPTFTGTPTLPTGTIASGSFLTTAIAAPGTPAAGKGSIYVDSTSKNLAVKDDAGVVKHGVQTKAAVSNSFATAIADDGTVTVAQPAFTNISGTATAGQIPAALSSTTSINGLAITASTGTLTITNAKTLSASNTLTLAGTDSTTMTFPSTSATIARTDAANTFTGHQTIEGVTSTGATGTAKFVFDTTPTIATPVLNHPTIGISGTSASSHVLTVGTAPSCVFTSGGGTGPSCAMETGSTDHAGTMTITTGSGSPGSVGTITLTFNATMATNSPACVTSLTKGATDWLASSVVRVTTQSTTAPVFTWNSNSVSAAVALTASTNYKISYVCFAK